MPRPCKLTFDLLTFKVVSESRVTWATSVPILVFLGLSVLDLGPMYARDRQTSDRCHTASLLNALVQGGGYNNSVLLYLYMCSCALLAAMWLVCCVLDKAAASGDVASELSVSSFSPRSSCTVNIEHVSPTAKAGAVVTSSRASKRRCAHAHTQTV